MREFLVLISCIFFSLLQTKVGVSGFHPDFLLVFFIFLVFKKFYFVGSSLFFIITLKIFSNVPLIMLILYWAIIEIIIRMWQKSFISIHKSSAFFLILGLSIYSFIFWNYSYEFGVPFFVNLLKYVSSNILVFLFFYPFIPEMYVSTEEE